MQNKKLRKALAVSMAIAMTGGLLAGCGSNNSSSSNGGATKSGSTSSASGELDTSEFVELSMYVISDRPAGQDAIDENLNKYSNLTTGKVYQAQPFPPFIQNIIKNGGLMKSIG